MVSTRSGRVGVHKGSSMKFPPSVKGESQENPIIVEPIVVKPLSAMSSTTLVLFGVLPMVEAKMEGSSSLVQENKNEISGSATSFVPPSSLTSKCHVSPAFESNPLPKEIIHLYSRHVHC